MISPHPLGVWGIRGHHWTTFLEGHPEGPPAGSGSLVSLACPPGATLGGYYGSVSITGVAPDCPSFLASLGCLSKKHSVAPPPAYWACPWAWRTGGRWGACVGPLHAAVVPASLPRQPPGAWVGAALVWHLHHQGGGCCLPCPCKVCLSRWEEAFWRLKAGGPPWGPGAPEKPNFLVCSLIGALSGALGGATSPPSTSPGTYSPGAREIKAKSRLLGPETGV